MEYFIEEEEYLSTKNQAGEQIEGPLQENREELGFASIPARYRPSISSFRAIVVISAILMPIFALLLSYSGGHVVTSEIVFVTPGSLPRIFWLYSRNELDGQDMFNQTMANYYIDYGRRMGYQVRLVNSWTSYEWLSREMADNITSTMMNVKIDVGVDELLILALLIEHGGVVMKNFDVIFLGDLKWVEQTFESRVVSDVWSCSPDKARVFLALQQIKQASLPKYSDSFMAALPGSVLLKEALQLYRTIAVTLPLPSYEFKSILKWNDNTDVFMANQLLQNCVSIVVERKKLKEKEHYPPRKEDGVCEQIGLQMVVKGNPLVDTSSVPEGSMIRYLTEPKGKCKQFVKAIFQFSKGRIKNLFGALLRGGKGKGQIEQSSILYDIISVPGNRQMFLEELPPREIEFCVVTMDELTDMGIQMSVKELKKQSYGNWSAVYFTKSGYQIKKKMEKGVTVLPTTGNKGHNIEQAITKHCPHRGFAILLNKGERFNSSDAFEEFSSLLVPRQVLGLFTPLRLEGELLVPHSGMGRFYRKEDGIVNPKLGILKNITNHFRIFSVQVYKFLPQFDLRDSYGNYFQDRVIFLMSFMDMIREQVVLLDQLYIIKKYASQFNVPRKVLLAERVQIITDRIDEIDLGQMRRTFTRIETESMHVNLQSLLYFKIPFEKMIVFNEGETYVPFDKKQGRAVIPRIIHQAWLGGSLPPAKLYFFKKTALMFPAYEMKLWTLDNITMQNFPESFEMLKTLEEFNSRSPFNKFATMTDILRHEALYRFGGFWKDAAMNILRPVLDDFRKYKLALPTDKTLRHRWLQGMCIFGNEKGYAGLLRVVERRHLSRMRIYNNDPMDIAGPVDFRWLVMGRQQYSPDILMLSYQTFYPAQLGQHPAGDLCTKAVSGHNESDFQIIEKEYGLLLNCSAIYPYAFGLEHNRYGVSWLYRTPKGENNGEKQKK